MSTSYQQTVLDIEESGASLDWGVVQYTAPTNPSSLAACSNFLVATDGANLINQLSTNTCKFTRS